MLKMVLLLLAYVSYETCAIAQTPLTVPSVVYNNITAASRLDACDPTPNPCIDNRSQFIRQSSYHSYRALGTGNWSVDMQYADGAAPLSWVSFGSTGQVSQAGPLSGVAFAIGPASITKPYHDYIRFVITGSATIQNYFASKQAWWPAAVAAVPVGVGGGYYVTADVAGNVTIDFANGLTQSLVLTAAAANILAPVYTGWPISQGMVFTLYLDQDATGGRASPTFSAGAGGFPSGTALLVSGIPMDGTPSTSTILVFTRRGTAWVLTSALSGVSPS